MRLQDILQAALFVETDFKQYSVAASLDTASMLNSKACDKPNNVEQLCDRNVSVAVSEIPDARLQCTDNSTSVSHTAPTNVAVDVAAMFRLSPDDFDDCLLYTSPSPRDRQKSRMPSSA